MDLPFRRLETPGPFTQAISRWSEQPRLWLDIEVADYYRADARVASLQIRDSAGDVSVVDCLAPGMASLLPEFVRQVMTNPRPEKWAHNARYEQRFLGREQVQNLHCTLALAKTLPYYRLPTRSWSLAALVEHFWGVRLDKSYQTHDWGRRPLPEAAWCYGAWDAEWCHRLWARLRDQVTAHDPPRDPERIARRFAEFDLEYKTAKKRRESVWEAVRDFLIRERCEVLGRFQLSQREYTKIELGQLVVCLTQADPHDLAPCLLSLTKSHQANLGDAAEAVRRSSEVVGTSQFRVPNAPRAPAEPPYVVDAADVGRVERDFEEADHRLRIVDSERDELKTAMKELMTERGIDELLGFRFLDRSASWRVDPRVVHRLAPDARLGSFTFTAKVRALLESAAVPVPTDGVESTTGWVMRWKSPKLELAHDAEAERFD